MMMESLQLHLTDAAWSWLSKLPKDSIGSRNELAKQFTSNFRSTNKRLASIEEIKACMQKNGESLRSYIQHWSVIKNSAEDVSDERAVNTFITRLRHPEFVKEMGRLKPKKVSELMDIAIRFTDGEDTYHNKRTCSPEDDRSQRYNNQRRRPRNFKSYGSHSQVVAGYRDNNDNHEDERRRNSYHTDDREESGPSKSFRPRTSREYNPSLKDILHGPCHMHYAYVDGKRVSNHLMRDC
jgi:hypothetical protein